MKISLLVIAATAVSAGIHAQTPIFGHRTYAGQYTYNHADLNNDGREDLMYHTQTGFAVVLSNGPGSYAAPVEYNVPNNYGSETVALDINNDGKLDVIAFNSGANDFYEYLNTGNGALKLEKSYPMAEIQDMVVGDFNHDGYADIAFITFDQNLHVWFNNHDGGFTVGPTTALPIPTGNTQMTIGDFDGDGAADLAVTSTQSTYLFFGDNTGHFTAVNATTTHHPQAYLMDIDGDGKSDLVGAGVAGSDGMYDLYYRDLWVVYGNLSRTVTESDIPLNGYVAPWSWGPYQDKTPSVDVADLNGDGKRDLTLVEAQNNNGTGTQTLVVKLGNGDRTWGNEENVYSSSELESGVAVLRATEALKPDLLVGTYLNGTQTGQFFLNDTSGGYFGGCPFPDTATGIDVCSPNTYTSTSAKFDASAAGQTWMRKMEVWVDGVKKYQQLADHDYSHYANLDTTLTLSAGTHQVTVIAAGYDNLELKKTYTITVK